MDFVRSDCNGDGLSNIADAIYQLDYLFGPVSVTPCDDACDSNDDGSINIGDAVFLLSELFSAGPPSPPPTGSCGPDPTADGLDCVDYPCPSSTVGPVLYGDEAHSPISSEVALGLEAIASLAPTFADDVFLKAGDSTQVSTFNLGCFAGSDVDLGPSSDLQDTLDFFLGGSAVGVNPFERDSSAAGFGWSTGSLLAGAPSTIELEVIEIEPQLALLLIGKNDVALFDIESFGENLLELHDLLTSVGVIPVFSTVPPRNDSASADALVPRYNGLIRALTQGRQTPLVDLHRELSALPNRGLSGDGVNLNVYQPAGTSLPCVLTAAGIEHGYNRLNLLWLQVLDRVNDVLSGAAAPDPSPATLQGSGTPTDPFIVDALPFGDLRNSQDAVSSEIDLYTGCGTPTDESGSEYYYRLEIAQPTTVYARIVDRPGAQIDLFLLDGGLDGASCIAGGTHEIEITLAPGAYTWVIDTYATSGGTPQPGEFLFTVIEE